MKKWEKEVHTDVGKMKKLAAEHGFDKAIFEKKSDDKK